MDKKDLTLLEKCGILLIALSAKNNMPLSPIDFQNRIGNLEADTGLTAKELREVYRYLQDESFKYSLPKERSNFGFKGGSSS